MRGEGFQSIYEIQQYTIVNFVSYLLSENGPLIMINGVSRILQTSREDWLDNFDLFERFFMVALTAIFFPCMTWEIVLEVCDRSGANCVCKPFDWDFTLAPIIARGLIALEWCV